MVTNVGTGVTTGVMTFGGTVSHITLSGTSTANTGKFATLGAGATVNFSTVVIGSTASMTVDAAGKLDANALTSYGKLSIAPATVGTSQFSLLKNLGSLAFGVGSTTEIGTVATANSGGSPTFVAGIDLNGQNAKVDQALLNNNGFVIDSTLGGVGMAQLVCDGGGTTNGSLVKGTGFFQNPTHTQNGGYTEAGDCPGGASYQKFELGVSAVGNLRFQITDAGGVAGPSPDSEGHVNGWGFVQTEDLLWSATSDQKLKVNLQSLSNTTTEGNDVAGAMANFDPTQSYSWTAVKWTGSYTGPTDVAALNASTVFDTSAFANSFNGTFAWQLDLANNTLYLTYTPAA
jgi:hypothetical protein